MSGLKQRAMNKYTSKGRQTEVEKETSSRGKRDKQPGGCAGQAVREAGTTHNTHERVKRGRGGNRR